MSNMYAIKEETLSALGDAVRSKLGFNEVKKTQAPTSIDYNDMIKIDLPVWASKAKVVGHCYSTTNTISSVFQGLGYAIGTNYLMGNGVRLSADYTLIINDSNNYLDENFEIIINSNSFTFVPSFNAPANPITVSFEITCLDENGNEFKYTPTEMVDKINELDTVPTEAFNITGDCSYRFAYNGWNWLVNQYGDKITTKDITNLSYMFYSSNLLEEIPFDINIKNNTVNFNSMFYSNTKLKLVPYIIGPERALPTSSYSHCLNLGSIFQHCHNFKYIPNDWFWKIVPNKDFWDKQATITTQSHATLFANCYSLRELPDISMLGGVWTSAYSNLYYNLFYYCSSLDKIENLLVLNNVNITSNYFSSTFSNCNRVKEITFETNEDGTPKTANWKSQTIDLTNNIGYANGFQTNILNYNSGITADKEVKDDATYQALKNDPDWFCGNINYSRYNHDSAVNTINSLPDTSAYGTNTIKFKGASGSATDGGAINTLTEEEIAVAAARGWTVTFA